MKRLSERLSPRFILSLALFVCFSFSSVASIHEGGDVEKGKQLFNANCASCHKITEEVLAAPGLAGIDQRWKGKDELLIKWIQEPKAAAASGDPYVKSLVEKYVGTYGWMANQAVSKEEIGHILTYVKSGGGAADSAAKQDENTCLTYEEMQAAADQGKQNDGLIWIIIIGVILAIIGVSAANISRSLKNAMNERDGKPVEEELTYWGAAKAWMWKHKIFVSLAGLFVFCYLFVALYSTLMDIGVYEAYKPEQPIWFSHASHVCKYEIDCQYCHSSAAESKHAGIPSANVCMNCHKGIKEGPITGKKEIEKIYAAIGFDPATGTYIENYEQKPIEWNKVHNLPDHVYFNHSQHVTVGGIDCKQCHGPVQTYSVGRQATIEEINAQEDVPGLIKLTKPTLTMGWCIECHNKAEIDLASSDYYEEMHNRFKSNELGQRFLRSYLDENLKKTEGAPVDSLKTILSVKQLGGWECGKCHY
jgi:mono/diheme cytochrome c family protein